MWKGKDQQDASDLEVPVVPIYIQEKIHPQALVENLRDTAKAGGPEPEQLLFDDFNGLPDFDARVDFYQHDQHWSNRMVLGRLAPREKLRRVLRAEIDEAAWSSLYSTTSRRFAAPESGRIAVKVINHYGDEVLKVFEV